MNPTEFIKNTTKNESGCWIWNKSRTSAGYGQLSAGGKYWTSHRYAYSLFVEEIPSGAIIRHKCHTRACCNPAHLMTGSHRDNYMDSLDKHVDAANRSRKRWVIGGVEYKTCKEAVVMTGISMHAVIKHTVNGVFDIDAYRKACIKAAWRPKV